LTLTLSEGPMGGTFEFTFERRGDIKLVKFIMNVRLIFFKLFKL
jgi:hypothetical protein